MRSARRVKTPPHTRPAFESLEPRAMLAGLGQDSLSGLGSTTSVFLPGCSSLAGIVLPVGSPALGSSGNSATPTSPLSSGSSPSNGLPPWSNYGSGTGSSTTGSIGNSTSTDVALASGTESGTGSSNSGTTGSSSVDGAAPPAHQAMPSLTDLLPAGYKFGPNSASDPVFRLAYAQWMAAHVEQLAVAMTLPDSPEGLGPEWTLDPNHRYPYGQRFRHPSGRYLDWHPGREGLPGNRASDHWHDTGGKAHLPPGAEIPDPESIAPPPSDPNSRPYTLPGSEPGGSMTPTERQPWIPVWPWPAVPKPTPAPMPPPAFPVPAFVIPLFIIPVWPKPENIMPDYDGPPLA